MDPVSDFRQVDTLRNVLVDELVSSYVRMCEEDGGIEMVMSLFDEGEDLQRVARRLQITFPPADRLVGMVLRRLSARWLEASGDQEDGHL